MKKVFLAFVLCGTLVSCATTKNESTMMHGMFVNESNIPVPEVDIYNEENFIGRSNANGFFEINVPSKDLVLIGKKSGWETKNLYEPFVDSTKLYIYKIKSLELIYAEIEKSILENDLQTASSLIENLEFKYGDLENVLFLKSILAYKNSEFEFAKQYLEESGFEQNGNPYIKKYSEKIGARLCDMENSIEE